MQIQGHHVGECAGQAVLGTQRNLQISSSCLSLDGNCLVSITDEHKMIFGLVLFFLSYEFMHWLLLLDFQLDGNTWKQTPTLLMYLHDVFLLKAFLLS